MPIPLVIGITAGVAGFVKTGKALYDNKQAKEANDTAQSIAKIAEQKLDIARKNCQEVLTQLGEKKVDTLSNYVSSFIHTFEQIKNINFQHAGDFGNLTVKDFSEVVLEQMRQEVSFVISSGLGIGGGTIGGAITAFGAYNGTMMFAAASTGTAISSLSGVAATNATLAWLGGGTLASGGMGVAGGAMALNALAAGPGLLIAGWYMGSKAKTNLNDAYSNIATAKQYAADVDKAIALTEGITEVALKASDIFSKLRMNIRRNLKKLKCVIEEQGNDFSKYNDEAKMVVLKNVKVIQVVKVALDTPILDKEGKLYGHAEANIAKLYYSIENGFTGIE